MGVNLSDGDTKEALAVVDSVEIVGEHEGDDGHELHEDVQGRTRSVLREREKGRVEKGRERGKGRNEERKGRGEERKERMSERGDRRKGK